MKKTLIALAVAASAFSGAAMAGWEANGTGGSMELSGTLTPADVVTPWEVKVGDSVAGLDADIKKGQNTVTIPVRTAIPVLGIRTQSSETFMGQAGISPQIDFNNAIDLGGFSDGTTTLTLDVKNAGGETVGTMTAPFTAVGVGSSYSEDNLAGARYTYMISSTVGEGFYGGLSYTDGSAKCNSLNYLTALSPDFIANINDQGYTFCDYLAGLKTTFASEAYSFSAAYGTGIMAGKEITITLNNTVQDDTEITWKATLPVVVSYM